MSELTANPTTEVLVTVPPAVAQRLGAAATCNCCPSLASAFGITSAGWGAWVGHRSSWDRFIAYLVPLNLSDADALVDALHLADPEAY